MRSIQYVLGGKPRNLDDCLDLSLKEKPIVVSLDLKTQERATEEHILKTIYRQIYPEICL